MTKQRSKRLSVLSTPAHLELTSSPTAIFKSSRGKHESVEKRDKIIYADAVECTAHASIEKFVWLPPKPSSISCGRTQKAHCHPQAQVISTSTVSLSFEFEKHVREPSAGHACRLFKLRLVV
jgi:hypothetical protein